MAKMQKKSGLAGKLGAAGAKAVKTHAEDETTYSGGGELPAGIENGIAQLVDCKFDIYKKGKSKGQYYFFAQASVIEPVEHEGIRTEGKYTNIMEPVHDTPTRKRKTVDDHIAWILNEMRKLGAETKDVGIDDLEELAASIQEAGPVIRFRTWKGEPTKDYPNPKVNHQWEGVVEDYDGEVSDDVDESSDEEDEGAEDEEEEGTEEEGVDLTALAAAADDDEDEESQQTLQDMAEENGLDPNDYGTWTELADALAEVLEGGEEEESEEEGEEEEGGEEEESVPEKEEVYFYRVPRKPGQKNGGKKVEAEVTSVVTSKKTVNLKDLSDGTLYKAVPWDKLLTE